MKHNNDVLIITVAKQAIKLQQLEEVVELLQADNRGKAAMIEQLEKEAEEAKADAEDEETQDGD